MHQGTRDRAQHFDVRKKSTSPAPLHVLVQHRGAFRDVTDSGTQPGSDQTLAASSDLGAAAHRTGEHASTSPSIEDLDPYLMSKI